MVKRYKARNAARRHGARMRKGAFVGLIALLIAAAVGWYFASPLWTLRQMASAAEAKDADRLSGYVDFPKLRESTKAQIKAQAAAELTSGNNSGLGALGTMIGMSMVDTMIDGVLTPQGMTAMFASQRAKSPGTARQPSKPLGIDATNRVVVRESPNRFRLHDKRKSGREGDLIFERRGLSWKLAEIVMPQNIMRRPDAIEEADKTRGD